MAVPLICFVTWNRAGLVARNLTGLLNTTDDFELCIVDNNSTDGTWKFIEILKDDRIIGKERMDLNRGYVYAGNYVLSKRKKDQYFITIDSDVCIKTSDWVPKFISAMETFPEVGLLGVMPDIESYLNARRLLHNKIGIGEVSYYQQRTVWGGCICLRPELLEYIGYFNEETGKADYDLWARINNFTRFKMGYIAGINIDSYQKILCDDCILKNDCDLYGKKISCFDIHNKGYKHKEFTEVMAYKHNEFMKDVKSGKRTVYCASIHDQDSITSHYYNKDWADGNFDYFIKNSN